MSYSHIGQVSGPIPAIWWEHVKPQKFAMQAKIQLVTEEGQEEPILFWDVFRSGKLSSFEVL